MKLIFLFILCKNGFLLSLWLFLNEMLKYFVLFNGIIRCVLALVPVTAASIFARESASDDN